MISENISRIKAMSLAPWDENARIAALRSYGILDTPREPEFDDLVNLAASLFSCPIAVITLIEDKRQWFKAEVGLGIRETPLDVSICSHVLLRNDPLVVDDLAADPRFTCNPLVTGAPNLKFYAGVPLATADGVPLGSLCILDFKSRTLTTEQVGVLQALARQAMGHIELRRAVRLRDEALAAAADAEKRRALLIRELHHRVRNMLALLSGMLTVTAKSRGEDKPFRRIFSQRIASLSATHALLTDDYWQTARVQALIENEIATLTPELRRRFSIEGPPVDLAADLAVPLGMAFHELVVNAVEHGGLAKGEGKVHVAWRLAEGEGKRLVDVEWREEGGSEVVPPSKRGVGLEMLQQVLRMQARAETSVEFRPAGLYFRMRAPLIEARLVPSFDD
jgi:two-component sensor histidine kinase